MAKDKKRSIDEAKKAETTFYHEIVGIACVVIAIIILGKLGKMGEWLTIFSKILFGDWFWFFILFVLFYGLYNLILHKSFDFKHQRFIGYIFFSLGLIVFAHFRMHTAIQNREGNYFKITWTIYMNFISTQGDIYLGGGLIGAIIFYLFYYLFGVIGVSLVAAILMMMGISLLLNKTLIEMYNLIASKVKFLGKYTSNFNRFFKYELGIKKTKAFEKQSIFSKNIKVPLKTLEEYQNLMNLSFQEKVAYDLKSLIHSVFNNLNIEYKDLKTSIGYSFTTFEFIFFTKIDLDIVIDRLKKVIDENIVFYKQNVNNVVIELNNKHFQILAIRNLLMMQESLYNNYIIPLGLNGDNKLEELDINRNNHLLLVGSDDSGIKNFVKSFLISLFVKQNLINYEVILIDSSKEFSDLNSLVEVMEGNINDIFDAIIEDIDNRMNTISKNNANTLEEYNKKLELNNKDEEQYKRRFIIINRYNDLFEDYTFFENKLMYITQLGVKCGINIIYIIRDESMLSSIILSIFNDKLIFKTLTSSFSISCLNNDHALYLTGKGDCYYLNKADSVRLQTAIVSNNDFINFEKYLLK